MKFVQESLNEYVKHLQGGKGDDLNAEDVDQDQLKIGVATEMEHTTDEEISQEIALDHLAEVPDYYTKLVQAGLVDEDDALELFKDLIEDED